MNNKLNLKSSDLLNKKFGVELSGYSAKEVDEYLDKALEDYRSYEEIVKTQMESINDRDALIQDKEDEIARLKLELKNTKEQLVATSKVTNASLAAEIKEIKKTMRTRNITIK